MKRYLLISLFILMIPAVFSEGWLSGWGQRVNITFDHNDIDNNLTDFPVLIYISDSSGIYNDDVTFIFDEIGDEDKKMAFTLDNGTTEIYAEIEEWNHITEKGWIWVKVNLSSLVDTLIYMYYASNQSDNNAYIGYTGSVTGSNIWDDSFVGVWHLNSISGEIIDSTRDFNGTPNGSPTYMQDGIVGSPAIDLDGTADYFNVGGDGGELDIVGAITIEAIHKPDTFADYQSIVTKGYSQYEMRIQTGTNQVFEWIVEDGSYHTAKIDSTYSTNVWYYTTGRITSGGAMELFIDAVSVDTETGGITSNAINVCIGENLEAGGRDYDGDMDEIRISNFPRSNAWIVGSFESAVDNLCNYSIEMTYYQWSGTEPPLEEDDIIDWSVWTQFTLIGTIVYCGIFMMLTSALYLIMVGR